MKKVMILTLAFVFALASAAMAAEVGGSIAVDVKYKNVDSADNADVSDETYDGVVFGSTEVTIDAAEEGVFDASVTLKADDVVTAVKTTADTDDAQYWADDTTKGIKLDAYKFDLYDDLFSLSVWGREATGSKYATPLAFVEAPSDADTVRFTSSVFGPEFVVDFSDKAGRVFGKYAVDPALTIGGGAKFADDAREYAVFGTGVYSGVTLSGEYFVNGLEDEDNTKYGLKAETTVSDVTLTGKFVRDNNWDRDEGTADDKNTELYFEAAYAPAEAPYSGSVAYTTKSFEDDDQFTKLELAGSFDVVPDFVTVTGSYLTANDKDYAEGYEVTWNTFDDTEVSDDDVSEYSKFELGASVVLTEKLTLEPSVTWETIKGSTKGETDFAFANFDEIKVTTLALDATYAVTDSAKVTYGVKSRTSDEAGADKSGVFHTLGVSLSF